MARKFNGTSDKGSVALNLSSFSVVTVAFWLYWDSYANNDKLAAEFGGTNYLNSGFLIDPNNSNPGPGTWSFGFGLSAGGASWFDNFVRPPALTWHHYALIMNRAAPQNIAYVDGALTKLTLGVHSVATYGNFSNSTLAVMCRNGASLFGAGRMAELAVWGGVPLTSFEAALLARGVDARTVRPGSLIAYPKMAAGQSPDLDYSSRRNNVTITGATYVPWNSPTPPLRTRQFYTGSFTAIKTLAGLTRASVKTVDGLAVASVKTWGGVA